MRIGMTYDLRSVYLAEGYSAEETAEFDHEDTVEAIEDALIQLGHRVDRIGHARDLVKQLALGQRWDLVFNICEGLRGAGREAQVPCILDVYQVPYTFSDPLVLCVCLDKGVAKCIVQSAGGQTPPFAVVRSPDDIPHVGIPFPAFAKPLCEGTGKGVSAASKILSQSQLNEVCISLLEQFEQPVLVEEFLPGREFTVGIVGTGSKASALGTMEILLLDRADPDAYSYHNKANWKEVVQYRYLRERDDPIVSQVQACALHAWNALGCRDGGRIDIRCNRLGIPEFIEANPLAGLHPAHSDLPLMCQAFGIAYVDLIRQILDSAENRIASTPAREVPNHAHCRPA
jgi:D-alanine-D-alanine ligase